MEALSFVYEIGKPLVMLFITLDPIGNIPYYQALMAGMERERRTKTLRLSVIVASVILTLFILLGDAVMRLFGITFDDFRIAAGIVLLISSVALLLDIQIGAIRPGSESVAIVPLATPLLAGPASISIAIYIKYHWSLAVAFGAIAVNAVLAYIILASGDLIFRLVGKQGLLVLDKFMSLLMAALAVSLIRSGVEDIIKGENATYP